MDLQPSQGPVLGPSPRGGGGLFAPIQDATVVAANMRRQPDHHPAGGTPGLSPLAPLRQLPVHCPQALPRGAAPASAAPCRQPSLSHYSLAVLQPVTKYSPHPQPAPRTTPWSPH